MMARCALIVIFLQAAYVAVVKAGDNPIDTFLEWADGDCTTGCGDSSTYKILSNCEAAMPQRMDVTDTDWNPMCATLDGIGCTSITGKDKTYKAFKSHCTDCKTKDDGGKQSPGVNDAFQMDCCATFVVPTEKTTAGPNKPTEKSTTTPDSSSEETTDATSTEPSDTSSPLLPPNAICAKIIAITALIAQLL